jgi:hypothetical protein
MDPPVKGNTPWTMGQLGAIVLASAIAVLRFLQCAMEWIGRGAATYDIMLDDVAEALVWVQNH